jgi:hypothetical protein
MDNNHQGVFKKIGILMAGAAFSVAANAAEPPTPMATPASSENLPDMSYFKTAYRLAVADPRVPKVPLCDKLDSPPASEKFRITVLENEDGGRLTFHGSKFRFQQNF